MDELSGLPDSNKYYVEFVTYCKYAWMYKCNTDGGTERYYWSWHNVSRLLNGP